MKLCVLNVLFFSPQIVSTRTISEYILRHATSDSPALQEFFTDNMIGGDIEL